MAETAEILIWCVIIESVQRIQLVPYLNSHTDEKLFPSQIAENVEVFLHNLNMKCEDCTSQDSIMQLM